MWPALSRICCWVCSYNNSRFVLLKGRDCMWYILAGLILIYTFWSLARWWKGRKKGCHGDCSNCPGRGNCGGK
ncbi:MAG: FeoB-associated Cys-rich membrane protein [Clostridia bacterium]|nr:FeoB-associated Cys-rich membrane protein [Clostridia bacterium]